MFGNKPPQISLTTENILYIVLLIFVCFPIEEAGESFKQNPLEGIRAKIRYIKREKKWEELGTTFRPRIGVS